MRCKAFLRSCAVVLVVASAAVPAVAAPAKKAADPQKIFTRKDANSDGSLSLEEYKTGLKPEQADKADKRFKRIDTDGDGKLSFEEFKAGLPKPKE
jgi:hypothetical protein